MSDENVEDPSADTVLVTTKNYPKQHNANKRKADDELIEVLKKKYMQNGTAHDDDDMLFLLSLHKDLASLPDHMKLNVKSQMLNVCIVIR